MLAHPSMHVFEYNASFADKAAMHQMVLWPTCMPDHELLLLWLIHLPERQHFAVRQEVGWYDKEENSSGAIAGRLSTDTLSIRGAVGDQLGLIIQNLVTIIGAYVIAFTAGWKMTLVITATVPLLVISAWTNAKFLKGFSTEVERALSYA